MVVIGISNSHHFCDQNGEDATMSSSETRTPCLLLFLFWYVFLSFIHSIRPVLKAVKLDDVESEQLFLEIARFIASNPRNISRYSLLGLFPFSHSATFD